MKEEVISILKKINNKKYFIIFFIYFILLIGVVIAENPEIFGHNPEEFNGFSWTGAIGELTYSNVALPGGHSTSEIDDVIWFNGIDGTQKGAILKTGAVSYSTMDVFLENTNEGDVTLSIIAGAQMNPGKQYFFKISKTNKTGYYPNYYSYWASSFNAWVNGSTGLTLMWFIDVNWKVWYLWPKVELADNLKTELRVELWDASNSVPIHISKADELWRS